MSHYDDIREMHEQKLQQAKPVQTTFEQESYTDAKEQVVVYAVLAYNDYYPRGDNVKGMFDSYSKAEQFLDKFRKEKDYYDNYKIVDYVLNQPT